MTDTAILVDISPRTVVFHLENVRRKLDAVSMPHCVAVALRRGWPAIFLAAFAVPITPNDLAAHPLALWFVGAVIVGLAIAYGIMRNRTRTAAEKRTTDQATKKLCSEEDKRDRVRTGPD